MISSLRVALAILHITADIKSAIAILWIVFRSFAKKITNFKEKYFVITIRFKNEKFSFSVLSMADIAAIYEIFVKKEYEFNLISDVNVIFDLGSNIGITSVYFSSIYKNAHIYAVEANPRIFEQLKENVKLIPNIIPVFGAISTQTGALDFFVNKSSLSSSIFERKGTSEKISVPCFNLRDLMKQKFLSSVDIIKFDIEGGEYDLFDSSLKEINQARVVIGEAHPDIAKKDGNIIVKKLDGFEVSKIPTHGERFIIKALKV